MTNEPQVSGEFCHQIQFGIPGSALACSEPRGHKTPHKFDRLPTPGELLEPPRVIDAHEAEITSLGAQLTEAWANADALAGVL